MREILTVETVCMVPLECAFTISDQNICRGLEPSVVEYPDLQQMALTTCKFAFAEKKCSPIHCWYGELRSLDLKAYSLVVKRLLIIISKLQK
jgi:hypothetical protein